MLAADRASTFPPTARCFILCDNSPAVWLQCATGASKPPPAAYLHTYTHTIITAPLQRQEPPARRCKTCSTRQDSARDVCRCLAAPVQSRLSFARAPRSSAGKLHLPESLSQPAPHSVPHTLASLISERLPMRPPDRDSYGRHLTYLTPRVLPTTIDRPTTRIPAKPFCFGRDTAAETNAARAQQRANPPARGVTWIRSRGNCPVTIAPGLVCTYQP